MPQDKLLLCAQICIDSYSSKAFQNAVGMLVESFLHLLRFYLKSTFTQQNGRIYIQKHGLYAHVLLESSVTYF